jgi:hypothetical protein
MALKGPAKGCCLHAAQAGNLILLAISGLKATHTALRISIVYDQSPFGNKMSSSALKRRNRALPLEIYHQLPY